MAITTTGAVYRDLHTRLRAGLVNINDVYIYMTPIPLLPWTEDKAIQLIPGVPEALEPRAGGGMIEEEFSIALWMRLHLDQGHQSTARITDETLGALALLTQIRRAMVQWYSDDDSVIIVPVQFLRGSVATESPDNPGWVYFTDTYRCGYELDWETPPRSTITGGG